MARRAGSNGRPNPSVPATPGGRDSPPGLAVPGRWREGQGPFEQVIGSAARAYTPAPVAPRSRPAADPLARFSPPVATWFRDAFAAPTPAQVDGWAAIAEGGHVLLHAPTGSGKTLAAFLWCLDRLVREPARPAPPGAATGAPPGRTGSGTGSVTGSVRILYVSPLKALTYDVERNLRAPLAGIALAGARLGIPVRAVSIASRTGDTTTDERRSIAKRPPEILITTPESLYLLLTSQAREILRGVEHVIVDEVHAVAGTKRGAHLALSLERLERLRAPGAPGFQRIGLSATQRPLETIGRFLAGTGDGRAVTLVDPGTRKMLDLQVVVPVEDMRRLGERCRSRTSRAAPWAAAIGA
jgi:ATP-dependent Lhr-like helicase